MDDLFDDDDFLLFGKLPATHKIDACSKCGSNEHYCEYGFAAGGLGSYTLCLGCDEVLERTLEPDVGPRETEQTAQVSNSSETPNSSKCIHNWNLAGVYTMCNREV